MSMLVLQKQGAKNGYGNLCLQHTLYQEDKRSKTPSFAAQFQLDLVQIQIPVYGGQCYATA